MESLAMASTSGDEACLTLDARFGQDVERLRRRLRHGETRTAALRRIEVKLPSPQGRVFVHMRGSDLYVLGFSNGHANFHLLDYPHPLPDVRSAIVLPYSSSYLSLGVWGGPQEIDVGAVSGAVCTLAAARTLPQGKKRRDLAKSVGLVALVVAESLRFDVVAGLFENLFSGDRASVEKSLLKAYVKDWKTGTRAGDPYVEVKWMKAGGR